MSDLLKKTLNSVKSVIKSCKIKTKGVVWTLDPPYKNKISTLLTLSLSERVFPNPKLRSRNLNSYTDGRTFRIQETEADSTPLYNFPILIFWLDKRNSKRPYFKIGSTGHRNFGGTGLTQQRDDKTPDRFVWKMSKWDVWTSCPTGIKDWGF